MLLLSLQATILNNKETRRCASTSETLIGGTRHSNHGSAVTSETEI